MTSSAARAANEALRLFDHLAAPAISVIGAFALVGEARAPLRHRTTPRRKRWAANAMLGALAASIARLVVVPAMVHAATRGARRGLLARIDRHGPVRAAVAFALLDYSVYAWHRANHEVPFLWRFHAAHHVDPDVDVTTAIRFHAVELLLSIPVRSLVIVALGATAREVVVYECAMQAAAMFHHANVRLPPRVERALSSVVITPTLHGTHHSDRAEDLSSNWGVVLSIWDRLHGTRRVVAQDDVRIGIPTQPSVASATDALHVLLAPLRGGVDST
jgi:sterol desaturase/sphingolipid hydroxylase (fatty acid hydroxylase superfamily)